MNTHVSLKTGVEAVGDFVGSFDANPSQDGLEFAPPGGNVLDPWVKGVALPERLGTFLRDIRLLRRVPLSYLVPDAALLPPESIRFFFVDQTWVDRVIDGVFSTTNTGTVDFHYSLTTLQLIREFVNPAPSGMTGMLIRSELTRRWPAMKVQAFSNTAGTQPIEVLRAEAISRDIFIALFAGEPKVVKVKEPFEGIRFGVEPTPNGLGLKVDKRDPNGKAHVPAGTVPIVLRPEGVRAIDIAGLSASPGVGGARMVAMHLEQRPYVQIFATATSEGKGSVEPSPNLNIPLRFGKMLNLDAFRDRIALNIALGGQ